MPGDRTGANQDTYPLISRIYPYSGGGADDQVTLAQTTRAARSGYTLDKAAITEREEI